MPSLTFVVDKQLKSDIEHFSWVNWSELNREELLKKEIFEEYIKTGKLSAEDREFCEKIDWHPVDELPLREEFIRELKEIEKGPHSKPMSPGELEEWFDEL